jgi:hypothetical protein
MPPTTSIQTDQYFVHYQGQVQGPFGVDFIEAMVMSGVYPSSVIVERVETSERLPFSNLVAAADSRPPSQKNPRSKKTKPETAVAWIAGVFGVCLVLWMISLVTSSKKPPPSRFGASDELNKPSSPNPQTESGRPSSVRTNYSPSASKDTYAPRRTSTGTSLPDPFWPTSRSNLPTDDNKIYRDASGRSYRVSNADYNRLLGMSSALIPKSALIDRNKKDRQALSSQLENERITLDQTSEYVVDSFNRKISRLNAMNVPLQILVDEYNLDVETFNTELERVGTPIN